MVDGGFGDDGREKRGRSAARRSDWSPSTTRGICNKRKTFFYLYANYDVVARGDAVLRSLARRRDGRDV